MQGWDSSGCLWRVAGSSEDRSTIKFYIIKSLYFSPFPFTLPLLQGAQSSDQPAACWLELRPGFGERRWALTFRARDPAIQTDAAGLHCCQNPTFKTETDIARGGIHTFTHRYTQAYRLILTLVYQNEGIDKENEGYITEYCSISYLLSFLLYHAERPFSDQVMNA